MCETSEYFRIPLNGFPWGIFEFCVTQDIFSVQEHEEKCKLFYRIGTLDEVRLSAKPKFLLSREYFVYEFAVEYCNFWLILS